jgi:succinoglycan biosynthesis protein ExoA
LQWVLVSTTDFLLSGHSNIQASAKWLSFHTLLVHPEIFMIQDPPPNISIVIPCRNENVHIEQCLRSIFVQENVPGGFEIIVSDGMSDDGTREILSSLAAEDSRLRLVDNFARTIPAGLNSAIRVARGKVIIRMDAHTEYASDYIRQCLAVLENTGADNVGGPARTKSTGYIQSAVCAAYHSRFSVGGAHFHDIAYEGYVDTVTYGCWPRQVFDRIGLFDEEFVRNEDDEINLRLRRSGGKIWQSPLIKSWYRPRRSLRSLFQQQLQYGYWKVRVIRKHKSPASVRHLVPGCFVLLLIGLILASTYSRAALWGWIGLGGLYFLCNLAASILTAWRTNWKLFPLLPIVFACYHFGYGYGFLRGLLDFVVLRREPAHPYTKLTRPSRSDLTSTDQSVSGL